MIDWNQIEAEFNADYDRTRALFGLLPYRVTLDRRYPDGNNDAYNYVDSTGQIHVQFNPYYVPTPPLTKSHRYIHETIHCLRTMLQRFGMTENYLKTRVHAYRFRGSPIVPQTWQAAEQQANGLWQELPDERFAELGVIAVMGYVERERTTDYGMPLGDPVNSVRKFFLDLVHEVSPVVYPTLYGGQPFAKSVNDDSLLFYYRASDNNVVAFNGELALLGATRKWW